MVDQVSRVRGVVGIMLLAALAGVGGCDKLSGGDKETAKAAVAPAGQMALPPRPAVATPDVVAKVNGVTISRRDVELAIEELKATSQALGQAWTPLPSDKRPNEYDLHDLVDALVEAELRSQDALASGLVNRDADLQRRFVTRYRSFLAQEWVGAKVDKITVDQSEVEKFYKDNELGFREPEKIKVREMVLATEEDAKAALVRLLQSEDFVTVARQTTTQPQLIDASTVDRWTMRAREKANYAPGDNNVRELRDEKLEQAAFGIDKANGVSNYVKGSDDKYHIFQLVQRMPSKQKPLVEVQDDIKNFLRLQKLSQMTEELKGKAKIELFPERLSGVQQ